MNKDLKNRKIDMLQVLEYVGKTQYRQPLWKCQCDCGTITTITEEALLNKDHVHSCGCYQLQFLTPGDRERCSKAGKARAKKRNKDGVNIDMLDNSKNIITNTSGHKGVSWSNTAHKWHVFIGYKNYRCNLGYIEEIEDAIQLREQAYQAIMNGTFEDFFYNLRGFRIEEKLTQIKKKK